MTVTTAAAPQAPSTARPRNVGRPPAPTRPAPNHPEPTGPRPRAPRATVREPAGEVVTRTPLTGAERRQWDRLHFQTALSLRQRRRKTASESRSRSRSRSRSGSTIVEALPGSRDLPDPRRYAAGIVTAAAEALSGHRPVDHLARWTTPEMFQALARRAGLALRLLGTEPGRPRPRARSVRTQITLSGNCEAAILLDDGSQVRAAAALLVPHHGRWVMSTLEIG